MPKIPSRAELKARYSVMREGWDVRRQSLYSFQAYAAAGATQLTFFALPVGQGGMTESDTNMTLAGQLPAGQEFLVQSLEVHFYPATPTVAADMPAAFGAQAIANSVNDAYIFYRRGNMVFTVGTAEVLKEAPLGRFPPKTTFHVEGTAADQSTIAASLQTRIAYAGMGGRPYVLSPADVLLTSNANFSVTMNWPEGVQAITNPARVGVVLDGYLYRRTQ